MDTSKKRLVGLKLSDFEEATALLVQNLTEESPLAVKELDISLAQDARDLRAIIFNNKDLYEQYRGFITSQLESFDRPTIHTMFNKIFKNMLLIMSGISHNKEQRELFSTISEKIVEPCQGLVTARDLLLIFNVFLTEFSKLDRVPAMIIKKYEVPLGKLIRGIIGTASIFATAYEQWRIPISPT